MRLTKKKAIEIAIELWAWVAETGRRKGGWDGWDKYGEMEACCPFCERQERLDPHSECEGCPIVERYGSCYNTYFKQWELATTKANRKKYAKLFLEQLKELGNWA